MLVLQFTPFPYLISGGSHPSEEPDLSEVPPLLSGSLSIFKSALSFDITIHYSCVDIMSRALLLHDSGFVFDIDACLSGRP